ncbi:MAG: AMP-binding protein, partial [Rhodanobacter sp.]
MEQAMTSTRYLPELIRDRAVNDGERPACRFFKGATLEPVVLTFSELHRRAAALASRLHALGLAGERALMLCGSQETFVVAFYACLLAGVVAVPAAPPRRKHLVERLQLMVRDSAARAVLFDIDHMNEWDSIADVLPLQRVDLRVTHGDDGERETPDFLPNADTPAFLQYTSGSTGDPKGVVVTHGNLVLNCSAIAEAMEITRASSLFTALPLFHDMGLVGGVLQLMYSGCVAGFMSPAEFVQYPERWLRILSGWRVTISGGPNFMFDLAARVEPALLRDVDLSNWRVAFCGAEPIRGQTFERFAQAHRERGFRASSFYPCYGMAESTLFITGADVGCDTVLLGISGQAVVGCGHPRGDTRVAIVDPATGKRMDEGATGEIWVSGGSVAAGYWGRDDLTR